MILFKKARAAHDKARKVLAQGDDPMATKRVENAAKLSAGENTFKVIALEWHGTKVGGWSKIHVETTMERLKKMFSPSWVTVP